jgi:hypothetical protein
MPQNQPHVTAAASAKKLTLLSDGASHIFALHNPRATLQTSKQTNGLRRNVSETQESHEPEHSMENVRVACSSDGAS